MARVWASSRRWWRTGKPGVLQSTRLQRGGPDWVTEQQNSGCCRDLSCIVAYWILQRARPVPGEGTQARAQAAAPLGSLTNRTSGRKRGGAVCVSALPACPPPRAPRLPQTPQLWITVVNFHLCLTPCSQYLPPLPFLQKSVLSRLNWFYLMQVLPTRVLGLPQPIEID